MSTVTSGNITVGALNAAADDVTLTSAGSISDGNAGTTNVTAANLTFSAGSGGFGSGDSLETAISKLEGTSAGGNVGISNSGGNLAIGGIGAATGVSTTTSGSIDISTAGGLLTVSEAVTAAGSDTVSLTGVGLTNSAAITGPGGVTLNAGTGTLTTASGTVGSTNAAITLVADTDIITTDGGGVTPVDAGTGTVTLRQSANTTTIGLAGGAGTIQIAEADLDDITAGTIAIGDSNTGTLTIGGALSNDDSLSFTSGTGIALNQNVTTSAASDAITFTGPVSLGANVTLGTNNGNVVFSGGTSTVDADSAGNNRTLTITAGTGTVTLGAAVGATQALADFDVTAQNIGVSNNVTVDAGSGGATATFNGTLQLSGNSIFDSDGTADNHLSFVAINEADASVTSLTLSAGAGNITLGGAVDGGFGLTVNSTGTVDVNGVIGGTTPITSLTSKRRWNFGLGSERERGRRGGRERQRDFGFRGDLDDD